VGVNHGLDLVLDLDSLEIIGACLSSKEERVALYEINREPRDVGGLVMSLDCRRLNVRNEGVNVNGVTLWNFHISQPPKKHIV